MSDKWGEIESLKFKDKLSVGSLSPNLSKSFIKESPVSLSLYITNSFLKELYDAHKQTDLSYIDIINSQISEFQLKHVERLLTRFTQLSYRVNTSLSTKYKGGRKRAVFLSEQIKVAIYQNELVDVKSLSFTLTKFQSEKLALEKRCAMLLGEMKQLQSAQSDLEFENCTFQISENHLKKEICNLKTNTSFLQNENENMKSNIINQVDELALKSKQVNNLLLENSSLSEQNRKLQSQLSSAPKDNIVGFDETGSKNKGRLLNNFAEKSRNALWFAESFGLIPKAIKCESESGKNVQVNLEKEYSNIEHEDKRKLRELIFILDKFCISDAAYHELASSHIELPRKNHIVQERAELDSMFQIERCPGNIPGVYVSVTNEIASFIRNNGLLNDKPFKIKVAGDGTRVSRISSFVTISMSFPESDNDTLKTLAILKCGENYEMLSVCSSPVIKEMNELIKNPTLTVDEKEYEIDVFFGGDMKFIQIFLGLCGATGNYACPWCLVNKQDRTDLSKHETHYESVEMLRTAEKLKSNASTKSFGSKNKPLIDIEPSKIVPDELHLLLRISDILLQNLIDDCKQLDAKFEVLQEPSDRLKNLVLKINECGVKFQTWANKAGELEWSSLTGNDYKRLFQQLPDKLFFVINNDTHDEVCNLWREFYAIYSYITKEASPGPDDGKLFDRILNWTKQFQGLSKKGRLGYDKVTPYMHCLLYHIPSFVKKYGKLSAFSGQHIEKLNDTIKFIHQKKSGKQNQAFDELVVRKRMEFLTEQDCERKKNAYTKRNLDYWEVGKKELANAKKRKIESEIVAEHEKYLQDLKANEKPLEEMTVAELKDKLKTLGKTTKIRKKEKLIALIRETETHV